MRNHKIGAHNHKIEFHPYESSPYYPSSGGMPAAH